MELWDRMVQPAKRVWNGVAVRVGVREYGVRKLRHDVRACEYEDVRVMWNILKQNETQGADFDFLENGKKRKSFWICCRWG